MSLAVATMNTLLSFSCIHVRNCPNNLVVTSEPEVPTPEKAFSISSIHKTHGLIASETERARLSPTYLPSKRPTSSLTNGILKSLAVAFAVRLFPQPGIPTIIMPFGTETPNLIALSRSANILDFRISQSLRFSSPPISSIVSLKLTSSSIPDFLINCFFSLMISCFFSELIVPPFW